jgi:hypothetical protein
MAVVVPIISSFDSKGIDKAIRDFKTLEGTGKKVQFSLGALNKGVGSLGTAFAKYGGIAAGVAGVVGGTMVKAAYESQKVMKQTEAIIEATGGAAGMTAKQVAGLAESMSLKTGIDDEAIQSSMNLLLTFKQVRNEIGEGNDIFNRASMAMLDLGNVFGSSDAAAKMLGKALSNPIKGVTALQRAGVNFTDQQKQQIKTLVESGKTLEAQKLILAEVESQVGGTAVASGTAFDRMRVALDNVSESLGAILIPYVERFATYVIDKVVPIMRRFSDIVGKEGIGGGLKFLAGEFFKATGNMGAFGNAVLALTTSMIALRGVMLAATIAQVAFNVALFANPIGIAVAAVIVLGVAIAGLAVKFKVVRDVFKVVWDSIVDATQVAINTVLFVFNGFTNGMIVGINLIIKAWNAIPFTSKVDELKQVNLALDITKAKLDGTSKTAVTSAADFRKFEESQKAVSKSLTGSDTGTGGSGGVSKSMETAKEKFDKFAETARTVASDQKNLRNALEKTAEAQKGLQTATDNVATAQAHLNKITAGYGAGSKEAGDATEALTDAQIELRKAGFDLEKSNFAVTDAEIALAEARKEGSPREIREAEIALEEARIAQTESVKDLKEATDAVEEAQAKLNETVNGATTESDTYKEAVKQLKEAQDAQLEAIDKVREAKEREIEVTRNLAKAEILLRKAKGKLTKSQKIEADRLLTELNTPVTVSVPQPTGTSDNMFGFDAIDWSSFDWSGFSVGGLATLAEGGIVTKPTLALIGEGGESEAVIPLSKLGNMGGNVYHVQINSKIADHTLPDLIVAELRKFNRRSGAINIQVA